jgi:hypothetical protein
VTEVNTGNDCIVPTRALDECASTGYLRSVTGYNAIKRRCELTRIGLESTSRVGMRCRLSSLISDPRCSVSRDRRRHRFTGVAATAAMASPAGSRPGSGMLESGSGDHRAADLTPLAPTLNRSRVNDHFARLNETASRAFSRHVLQSFHSRHRACASRCLWASKGDAGRGCAREPCNQLNVCSGRLNRQRAVKGPNLIEEVRNV